MEEIVKYIVDKLVAYKDAVKVSSAENGDEIVITVVATGLYEPSKAEKKKSDDTEAPAFEKFSDDDFVIPPFLANKNN